MYKLTYPQAGELLWMAGHPFDTNDPRDYEVAVCIATKTYRSEKVDRILEEKRLKNCLIYKVRYKHKNKSDRDRKAVQMYDC